MWRERHIRLHLLGSFASAGISNLGRVLLYFLYFFLVKPIYDEEVAGSFHLSRQIARCGRLIGLLGNVLVDVLSHNVLVRHFN
jgi:hypothetical protein